MQCNKTVDCTSSKNFVSDTSKFQSFSISLHNVDNKDKSLLLPFYCLTIAFLRLQKHFNVKKLLFG